MSHPDQDFLLPSETAKVIFREIENLPVYDIHTHVDLKMVLENKPAADPWTALCAGDHYVSSVIESLGAMERERFHDPATAPFEKWCAYAEVFPYLLGNHVRDWMRITLAQLGIERPFRPDEARRIWDELCDILGRDRWRPTALFNNYSNLRLMSTTNHPTDSLEEHRHAEEVFAPRLKWIPTWRPDAFLNLRPSPMARKTWLDWVRELEKATDSAVVGNWNGFLGAFSKRHDFFGDHGCRGSDYGVAIPHGHDVAEARAAGIFDKACRGQEASDAEAADFQSFMLRFSIELDFAKEWFAQIHFGVARNQRRIALELGGLDSGCDTIDRCPGLVTALHDLLNHFDGAGRRHRRRLLLYSSAKADWERIGGLSRIFPSVYSGMSWWYFDSVSGMLEFLRTMPDIGAGFKKIGPFVTDARNIYSLWPRTQMYRRCLATVLGELVDLRREPLDDVLALGRCLCTQQEPGDMGAESR